MELASDLQLIPPKRTALLVGDPTLLLAIPSAAWFSALGVNLKTP
jgi:hypothetical protein